MNKEKVMISTHALTWSATCAEMMLKRGLGISTHALTWSATLFCPLSRDRFQFQLTRSRGARRVYNAYRRRQQYNFNSRAHVERDSSGGNYTDSAGISTHALMWSATRPSLRAVTECRISTHALMWSATCAVRPHHRLTLFQLTRSCGARPKDRLRRVVAAVFQLTRSCGARRA